MPAIRLTKSALVAAALTLFGTANALAADGVAESFERMLAHQPGHGITATAADRDADPLVQAMVVPLRDGQPRILAKTDPVAESFARMLAHQPGTVVLTASSDRDHDPLVAAMVEPLRRWLASSAAMTRLAKARTAGATH